jgi:hypothetical protein
LRQKADIYAGEQERVNPYDVARSVLTGSAIGTAGGLTVRHAEDLTRRAKSAINDLREVSQSIQQMGRAAEKAHDVADKASGSRFYGIFSKRAMRTRAVQQMPSRTEAEPEEATRPSEPVSLDAHAEEMLDWTAEAAEGLTEIRKQVAAGRAPWEKDSLEESSPFSRDEVHDEESTDKAAFPKTAYLQNGQATPLRRPSLSSPVGTYGGVARGRNAAARTAGKTAPTGRESESEDLARSVAIPTAALGTLGGMALARRYRPNIQRGVEGLYRRLMGNRLKRTASRRAADVLGSLVGGLGGGLLTGHATGALVGGSKRLEERLRPQSSPELDRTESTPSNTRENTSPDERGSHERQPTEETTMSVNSRSSGRPVADLGRDPVIRKSAGVSPDSPEGRSEGPPDRQSFRASLPVKIRFPLKLASGLNTILNAEGAAPTSHRRTNTTLGSASTPSGTGPSSSMAKGHSPKSGAPPDYPEKQPDLPSRNFRTDRPARKPDPKEIEDRIDGMTRGP